MKLYSTKNWKQVRVEQFHRDSYDQVTEL